MSYLVIGKHSDVLSGDWQALLMSYWVIGKHSDVLSDDWQAL